MARFLKSLTEIRQQKADLGSARVEGAPDSTVLMSADQPLSNRQNFRIAAYPSSLS
jgi:hypothetical protein